MALSITALSVGRAFDMQRPLLSYLRGWGETMDIPLIMYVIQGGPEGPVVVDTGPDIDRAAEFHNVRMEQDEDERPDVALKNVGVDPRDVRTVVNTHLHWDHSSNNHMFPNARVVVQQRELDFARSPVSWHERLFKGPQEPEPAWMRAESQITPIDGGVSLARGISVIPLPGHTPGSQGVLVDAESTRYLIAGDCVYLYENWEGDAEFAHIPSGLYTDLHAFEDSLRRIETLECDVIPSHDLRVLDRRVFQ